MIEKRSLPDRIADVGIYTFLGLFALFCLFPFWIMIVASFTDDLVLRQDGYLPWARQLSLEGFRWVIKGGDVRTGYMVSVFVTVVRLNSARIRLTTSAAEFASRTTLLAAS